MVTFGSLGKMGRLGNQMFQIASTIGIAKDNGHTYGFMPWLYSQYFKNQLPLITASSIWDISEKGFTYNRFNLSKEDYAINGYLQSPKYWEGNEQEILKYFEFNKKSFPFELQLTGSQIFFENDSLVAMHVRRGDYLNIPDYHTNLTVEYYNEALKHFEGKRVCIFSDDIEWCAQTFTHERFFFSHEEKDINDLFLMSHFKNIIIANSSFSWWAAYLNQYTKDKKVIAPRNWFGPKCGHSTEDLIPKSWLQI